MNTPTPEQSIYARVASESYACFSEVVRLTSADDKPTVFTARYTALCLRLAIEAVAFAAIAPNKTAYEKIRGEKFANDWRVKQIFESLEKLNENFFPLALTGPKKNEHGIWQYGRHSSEPFPRSAAEAAYDNVCKALHTANPWGDAELEIDLQSLSDTAQNGMILLNQHAAFIKAETFNGCWIVSRQPNGDWRFLTAPANGNFEIIR